MGHRGEGQADRGDAGVRSPGPLYGVSEQPRERSDVLRRFEFRVHSQNFADGILLYLLSVLGTTDRRFIEFGCGDGRECNTATLSLNFGFHGLLIDRDPGYAESARTYYLDRLGRDGGVKVVSRKIDRDNVNDIFHELGMEGELDLLSIDIDGNDYWVWEAIDVVRPRVVVIEFNPSFGIDKAITVPYEPDFDRFAKHPSGFYHGASLPALAKLGRQKGYMLVHAESGGVDAFFVRRDVGEGRVQEHSPEKLYVPSDERAWAGPPWVQFEMVRHLGLVEV